MIIPVRNVTLTDQGPVSILVEQSMSYRAKTKIELSYKLFNPNHAKTLLSSGILTHNFIWGHCYIPQIESGLLSR